eukprot:m.117306 g.117306  ORF g.117306 m.117306 type:complete len:481 (-) comp15544_c0_seq1:16-1458(-)
MTEPIAKRAHYARATTLHASHPHGVQPYGNCYGDANSFRQAHLGNFSILSDELLLDVLSRIPANDLLALAQCSRWFYCFANHDDVWRQKLLSVAANVGFDYVNSWKTTYLHHVAQTKPSSTQPPLRFDSVFSDYLFEPWVAHSLDLDPSWLQAESVTRCPAEIDVESFLTTYDRTSTPAVLINYTRQWPAYERWTRDYLISQYPDAKLNAGAATLTFAQYFAYASQQQDERPLYVFDKLFVAKCPPMEHDYSSPLFASGEHDLFALLGPKRPAYRWLICGPQRSGSNWHVDPNATSAWNGLLQGRKRWIFCPPGCPPPGVFPSPDGAAVATPISITEWMKDYYHELVASGNPYYEVTQETGDLVFVPSGWWHMVLNLSDTVAITQNYISSSNLAQALRFLRDKPDQVSGTERAKDLYSDFATALQAKRPKLWAQVQPSLVNKPSLWNAMASHDSKAKSAKLNLATSNTSEVTSFSFGFGN